MVVNLCTVTEIQKGSRRGAEDAEVHSPQRHAGAEGVQSITRFSIHTAT